MIGFVQFQQYLKRIWHFDEKEIRNWIDLGQLHGSPDWYYRYLAAHPFINTRMVLLLKNYPGDLMLEPDWALQHPNDYINGLKRQYPHQNSQIDPDLVNDWIDLPVHGHSNHIRCTPLALIDEYRDPHA